MQARVNAEASMNWRFEMWEWALDDREHFIQDKVFGDGFSRDISIVKANIYEEAYNLSQDQSSFAAPFPPFKRSATWGFPCTSSCPSSA